MAISPSRGARASRLPIYALNLGQVPNMFRGLTTSCGREGLFTAGYMGIGPAFARKFEEDYGLSTNVAKCVGLGLTSLPSAGPSNCTIYFALA